MTAYGRRLFGPERWPVIVMVTAFFWLLLFYPLGLPWYLSLVVPLLATAAMEINHQLNARLTGYHLWLAEAGVVTASLWVVLWIAFGFQPVFILLMTVFFFFVFCFYMAKEQRRKEIEARADALIEEAQRLANLRRERIRDAMAEDARVQGQNTTFAEYLKTLPQGATLVWEFERLLELNRQSHHRLQKAQEAADFDSLFDQF